MSLNNGTDTKAAAFKVFFETYYAPFCLFAKRYVADAVIREDIVQGVFVELWDEWDDSFTGPERLAFVKMCVHNACINHLKRIGYEGDYHMRMLEQGPVYADDPMAVFTINELYARLYEALEQLPKHCSDAFVKSFFEGRSHEEIAVEMGVSIRSVNRYKQKTLEMLQHALREFNKKD